MSTWELWRTIMSLLPSIEYKVLRNYPFANIIGPVLATSKVMCHASCILEQEPMKAHTGLVNVAHDFPRA